MDAICSSETCGSLRTAHYNQGDCDFIVTVVMDSNLTQSFQFSFHRFSGRKKIRSPLERQTRLINSASRTI
jgi:hypothetical protein